MIRASRTADHAMTSLGSVGVVTGIRRDDVTSIHDQTDNRMGSRQGHLDLTCQGEVTLRMGANPANEVS